MEYRKIIHVDMDAFFASVEQLDDPSLRGKPIVVGHDVPRGVVSTASYEARPYGVHSAQSIVLAKKLCPNLIIVNPHFDRYKEISHQIHSIFHEYTDIVQPVSIDEAFLDVTENKPGIELARDIALQIKEKIRKTTGLTASAGVSYCKFLAKIASDYRKPDGICTIHPAKAQEFIDRLPIEKFWGIGSKTAEKMHYFKIFTGADLRERPLDFLVKHFGKAGVVFYNYARGIDNSPVVVEWVRKSFGCEHTFAEDLKTEAAVMEELNNTVEELVRRLSRSSFEGKSLTLKIKFDDFSQITRSLTQDEPLRTKEQILPLAEKLMAKVGTDHKPIRLLGLSVSMPDNLSHEGSEGLVMEPEIEWNSDEY